MLMKLTIIIAINHFVIIVNFCNHFVKALTEIFHFRRALILTLKTDVLTIKEDILGYFHMGYCLLSSLIKLKPPFFTSEFN
jgi:hypothetical protein